jgi:predicted ribonuclease YlaK
LRIDTQNAFDTSPSLLSNLNLQQNDSSLISKVIFVFDTNIFISNLHELIEITCNHQNNKYCHYAVPWIVLQELDRLKVPFNNKTDSKKVNLSSKAIKAIEFISNILDETSKKAGLFSSKMKSNFLFESPSLSKKSENIKCDLNDDRIINYSLQLKKDLVDSSVVLVTNDRNLINKALINSLQSFNFSNLLKKLELLIQSHLTKTNKISINHHASTSMQETFDIIKFTNNSKNPYVMLIWEFIEKIVN